MSSDINWALQIDPAVYKTLEKFPRQDRERIYFAIKNLVLNPFLGDIQKMKGEQNSWRRRIGSYRIFYEIIFQERTIYVFKTERRTSNTY